MWDTLKKAAQHPVVQFLRKLCGDPVQVYAVFLVMTCMYYYHEDWTWLYTIIAVFVSFVLMRFYDFVARKGFLGSICYLVYLFAGLYGVNMLITMGRMNYPISFGIWFLTPQSVVDFSPIYTIAIYLLMIGFLTSTVYYFAKVRYRMTMQFLIMLIPLSLYAKEGAQMPALLVIILLASYFLLMVYCRQIRENKEVRRISNFHGGLSVAVYVAAFSILAAIVPKPAITADREFIDNAMAYSTISDVLMSAISMFTETTDNTGTISNSARTLYYVDSPEALRLRTQTFTYYSEDDSWSVIESWDKPDQPYAAPMTYKPQTLLQAILDTAAEDADFAETYGLTGFAGETLPEQRENELYLYTWYGFRVLPSPTRTNELQSGAANITISATNAFQANYRGATLTYYPDTYARSSSVLPVLEQLNNDEYSLLLHDASAIAEEAGNTERQELLDAAYDEVIDADLYHFGTLLNDWHSDAIDALAEEITEGLTSDIDKALAIERYFTEQGYLYDADYVKAEGENIEDFLTVSHRGVCYEFATAMTLLCRSAGLPTRFAQGYNMNQMYNATDRGGRETNYVIKERDAHAFPEVYISGYGWMSFEPTVASMDMEDDTAENQIVMRWGFVLLGLLLLAGGVYLLLPSIREKKFRKDITKMQPEACAAAMFCRMRNLRNLPDSTTVHELGEDSAKFFADAPLFAEIDVILYGTGHHSTTERLSKGYVTWQEQRAAYEKAQRKLAREAKKARKGTNHELDGN